MNAGEVREAIKVISSSRSRQLRDVDVVALRVLRDAARELLTIMEAGALIITPDEDGTWPRWTWQFFRASALAIETLDALRDAMPDGDT